MSEKLLEDQNTHLDDEAFLRLQKLKKIPFKPLPRDYAQQSTVLETALEYSLLASSKEELVESEKIVSRYDPIMWDLINEHIPSDSYSSYRGLLKSAILILEENREEIDKKYEAIILPYQWGGKLNPKHAKYQDFVSKNFGRSGKTGLAILALALVAGGIGAFAGLR